MTEISIRAATPEDAGVLAQLEHESAIHHASLDPVRWRVPPLDAIDAFMRRRQAEGGEVLVAEADGAVVGMVEVAFEDPGNPGGARVPGRLMDLGITVAEGWRGKGVGERLMRAAEDLARGRGVGRITLDMAVANEGARRFYERLGYGVHGLLMDKALEDGLATSSLPGDASGSINEANEANEANEPNEANQANEPNEPNEPNEANQAKAGAGDVAGAGAATATGAEVAPVLRGEQVRLRPLVESDRAALVEVLSDPSVVAIWDTRGPENSARELLEGEKGWFVWAIEAGGEFAGSVQASEDVEDPDYRHAGIDIFLSSQFQGRGLGTDAVRTVARWLIDVRGHHRLTIDPAASNARAIRTYEKVGFRTVGVMREYERGQDGTFHDGLLMDLLARELT